MLDTGLQMKDNETVCFKIVSLESPKVRCFGAFVFLGVRRILVRFTSSVLLKNEWCERTINKKQQLKAAELLHTVSDFLSSKL